MPYKLLWTVTIENTLVHRQTAPQRFTSRVCGSDCEPCKMKTVLVFAFLVSIPVGYGLKCYECGSTKSWDDCDNVRKEITCDSSLTRCVKATKEVIDDDVSSATYVKSCALSSKCDDTSDFCKSDTGKVKNCDANCCSGDLCNGGKVPMVSAIVLLACTLVAFLR